jgi:hypothetical protein
MHSVYYAIPHNNSINNSSDNSSKFIKLYRGNIMEIIVKKYIDVEKSLTKNDKFEFPVGDINADSIRPSDNENDEKNTKGDVANKGAVNLTERIRRLEVVLEKSFGNTSNIKNSNVVDSSDVRKMIGNYIITGQIDNITQKRLGVLSNVQGNANALSLPCHTVIGGSLPVRIAEHLDFQRLHSAEQSIKILRFVGGGNANLILNNGDAANLPADPEMHIINLTPCEINYPISITNAFAAANNANDVLSSMLVSKVIDKENSMILNGLGQNGHPLGILSTPRGVNANDVFAIVKTTQVFNEHTIDSLMELIGSVSSEYHDGAEFWMNYDTFKLLLSLKIADEFVLWNPQKHSSKAIDSLFGYKVNIMPIVNLENHHKILFGNFKKHYTVGATDLSFYRQEIPSESAIKCGARLTMCGGIRDPKAISELHIRDND